MRTPSAPSLPPPATSSNARRRSTLNSTVGPPVVSKQAPVSSSASTTASATVARGVTGNYRGSEWGDSGENDRPIGSSGSISDVLEFKQSEKKNYYETQTMMPAPGQTYFQLVIQEGGTILLRDWPRQRLSQKWTRDGTLNPGSTQITLSEFLDGELKEKLVWIFGEKVYEEAINAAIKCVQDESEKMREMLKGAITRSN
ncbi:hypothetical protein BC829DRAFT_413301 [Chytridium lagenaria]|nr:hypothetical protein BC829DRAFT_413301 [Chytridium lagenaria]